MALFNWADPFLIDKQLSSEEKMIMETARKYSEEKLLPRIKEAWKNENTDPSIFKEMVPIMFLMD